uniref:Uncharacterized protein n=1 Tax=Lynx canadensis TaxID=61383 RepID=A0A667GM71_LYNCA
SLSLQPGGQASGAALAWAAWGPRVCGCPELMWMMGNHVWKFKNKSMRQATSLPLQPDWRVGRGKASLWRGVPARAGLGMAAMMRNPGNCIDTEDSYCTCIFFFFFCIKVCMVSNKGLKCNSL